VLHTLDVKWHPLVEGGSRRDGKKKKSIDKRDRRFTVERETLEGKSWKRDKKKTNKKKKGLLIRFFTFQLRHRKAEICSKSDSSINAKGDMAPKGGSMVIKCPTMCTYLWSSVKIRFISALSGSGMTLLGDHLVLTKKLHLALRATSLIALGIRTKRQAITDNRRWCGTTWRKNARSKYQTRNMVTNNPLDDSSGAPLFSIRLKIELLLHNARFIPRLLGMSASELKCLWAWYKWAISKLF